MDSLVGRPASVSSIGAGLVRFLGFLLPTVATPIFTLHIAIPGLAGWLKPYDFVFSWGQPLAVLWVAIMSGVNCLGVRLGGAVQVFLAAIKIISVVIVIGVAFFSASPAAHAPDPIWPEALDAGVFSAFLAALAAALWAYDGWEDLNLVGSEVQDPQRNFPRALVGGVSLVAIIYLLFSAACLKVLPVDAVASSQHIPSDVGAHFRMRRTEPDLPRPYRCWGYPWVPGIFVAGALALTVNIWIDRPVRCSIGLLLILAGLPFYRHWRAQSLRQHLQPEAKKT